jgi:hypothetical protein
MGSPQTLLVAVVLVLCAVVSATYVTGTIQHQNTPSYLSDGTGDYMYLPNTRTKMRNSDHAEVDPLDKPGMYVGGKKKKISPRVPGSREFITSIFYC